MRICTLIPIQEALKINCLTNFKSLDCLVDVCACACQVRLNSKCICCAVLGDVEVQVIAVSAGAVPVVNVGCLIAVRILEIVSGAES